MNGSRRMMTLTLSLLVFLSHNAVVCQGQKDIFDKSFGDVGNIEVTDFMKLFDFDRGDNGPAPDADILTEPASTSTATLLWTPDPDTDTTTQATGEKTTAPGIFFYFYTFSHRLTTQADEDPDTSTDLVTSEPVNIQMMRPKAVILCVDREEVIHKNAVKVELKYASTCEETSARIGDFLGRLCEDDCKHIEIFQDDNSKQLIVSGESIEANAMAMAQKFKSDGVKEKLGVVDAVPHWGRRSSKVLVSLLVTGLILAALLLGGYVLRHHCGHRAKGIRLAEESFQMDEESQGNTLVSVAPLRPQEPQQKPSVNGESPDGGKSPPPPTNGHSATKVPVSDTEL